MKDELTYWRDLAVALYEEHRKQAENLKYAAGMRDEDVIDEEVRSEMECTFGLSEEEDAILLSAAPEHAYGAYVNSNTPKLHQYIVSFEVPAAHGRVTVKARDEDEAEKYVDDTICVSDFDTYMCDTTNVVEDLEMDGDSTCIEITDVEDDGEYEEDQKGGKDNGIVLSQDRWRC